MCHQPLGTDVCITFKSSLMRGRFTNPHGTQKPRQTPRTDLSPPRLKLQELAQRHMVSRAQRETTKIKHMHHHFSATTRLAPGVGCGFLYFRSKAVLGLPVSTTSYSRHAASTVQSPISTADNGTVLNQHRWGYTISHPVSHPILSTLSIRTHIK